LIRTMPTAAEFAGSSAQMLAWVGRATGVVAHVDVGQGMAMQVAGDNVSRPYGATVLRDFSVILHRIRTTLQLSTGRSPTVAVAQGSTFDYFDAVRKIVEAARSDLLFVDPYLDAEFVARYMPMVTKGVAVRLLGRERQASLVAGAQAWQKQHGTPIQVRSAQQFHDRYVFVDGGQCFQSGATFKDGGKTPTVISEIRDAFPAMKQTYEALWAGGNVLL
jgi:hypothetical protein